MTVNAEAVDWTLFARVTVELRHSDPAAGSLSETQLLFSASGPSSQEWQFTVGDNATATYAWQATYAAHDGSLLTSQEEVTTDDVLVLPPTAPGVGGQLALQVDAQAIDWTVIARVVVEVRYADPAAAFTTEDHLVFSSDTARTLVRRFIVPGDRTGAYQWEATYLAHDGRTFVRQGEGTTVDGVLSVPPATG
ncbi:hypothetical protein LL946_11855 [Knoellia locipacati]|uniref:hypothetical protein n=1 Tax=Knoellia locipacati TaxID=882824 RepID=UPI00384D6930